MLLSQWSYKCPKCSKRIIFEEGKPKTLIRCSKCSLYILLIRGESHREVFDLLTIAERRFFDFDIINYNDYYLLVGTFNFNEENILVLNQKSQKLGKALELFLFDGNKKRLTTLQKNILHKLNAENILEIQKKIEEIMKYLEAKIECIKILRILNY